MLAIGPAVETSNWVWTTSGNAAWFGQTLVTHDGVDAAQSGSVTHSQTSSVQTTVSGPGTLSFWWKVSSEEWFDSLNLYVDGLLQDGLSGESGWRQKVAAMTAGTHVLKWSYLKDASVSAGSDAGWLDQVFMATNPPVITTHPLGLAAWMGATVPLNVIASGAPTLTYQWLKAGTNLPGATSSVLNLLNVGRRDRGIFTVLVSNPGGGTLSSNASVQVFVPQRFSAPTLAPDGSFSLISTDADGGLLSDADLAGFEALVSTNLTDWVSLTNALSITNGTLLLRDAVWTNYPARFYRIREH